MRTHEEIDNIFQYHSPKGDQGDRYGIIRATARSLAHVIIDACPESAERTLALRDLQRCTMMANASIAIHE